jgi:hypothetical protein
VGLINKFISISAILISVILTNGCVQAAQPSILAMQHLNEVMDRYHSDFDVYTDSSSAGNHFVMPSLLGTDASINLSSPISHSGSTAIENTFSGSAWGGWYFMNGILEGDEASPKNNFGVYPDAGYNLTGATRITFWAKGKNGGERVEFLAFGVGRDPDTGIPVAPYPDSSSKRSIEVTLSNEWKEYEINISDVNLSYVLGGFGWVTNAQKNNGKPITFYLDDIRYDLPRLDEPRFLVSYDLLPADEPVLKNTGFTYDNALAMMAFLSNGTDDDINRAKLIADAFVYSIGNDRYFTDGRLRDGYQGGDLEAFPGWNPHGKKGTVRMPGWSDKDGSWKENSFSVGTSTGNMAWAMLGLISFYEKTHEKRYLDAAVRLGEWIENETRDERGDGGYTGGYAGWEKTVINPQGQVKNLWKSTEHNIDVYAAFSRLYVITGNKSWDERAIHARRFVVSMWNGTGGHFWTGTLDDGFTINYQTIPLDINTWGYMALGDEYAKGIQWAQNNTYVESDGFRGFDFNNDRDGVWFEGTAQMACAFQIAGEENKANIFLSELEKAQKTANNTNGKGIIAASHDGVSTGFEWKYDARPHVGATSWFIFAEQRYNPFEMFGSIIADCGADKLRCENVGTPVQFNGSASNDSDGVIVSYDWNFGDGTNATGVAPVHKYFTYIWNGTAYQPFTVNLTVTDDNGLTNRTLQKVVIWITGDANGDGKVNILDASVIGLKWGTTEPCADLNNDGKVNIIDASIIGLNWGKTV